MSTQQQLLWAAAENNVRAIQTLVTAGALVNGLEGDDAPIYRAAARGHVDAVKVLLDLGADVNGKNTKSDTALNIAAINWRHKVVNVLIERGADVTTARMQTALRALCSSDYDKPVAIMQALLRAGADVNGRDGGGHALLSYARSVRVARLLVAAGADVNASVDGKAPPLHAAIILADRTQLCEWVAMLIEAGADVNAATDDGLTPLHCAIKRQNAAVFSLLIAHGARTDGATRDGMTPLALCIVGLPNHVGMATRYPQASAAVEQSIYVTRVAMRETAWQRRRAAVACYARFVGMNGVDAGEAGMPGAAGAFGYDSGPTGSLSATSEGAGDSVHGCSTS